MTPARKEDVQHALRVIAGDHPVLFIPGETPLTAEELSNYLFQSPTATPLTQLSGDAAGDFSDALADVLCWFAGFRAGNSDADLPPGWQKLRDLNIILKQHMEIAANE